MLRDSRLFDFEGFQLCELLRRFGLPSEEWSSNALHAERGASDLIIL